MKIDKHGILEYSPYVNAITKETEYRYYVCLLPNWLPKNLRYLGYSVMWHDGPHATFGFWWFNIGWCSPWTKGPKYE